VNTAQIKVLMCWKLSKQTPPITFDFQLVDYLRMKFGKIDVVGRPQIERKNIMKTQLH